MAAEKNPFDFSDDSPSDQPPLVNQKPPSGDPFNFYGNEPVTPKALPPAASLPPSTVVVPLIPTDSPKIVEAPKPPAEPISTVGWSARFLGGSTALGTVAITALALMSGNIPLALGALKIGGLIVVPASAAVGAAIPAGAEIYKAVSGKESPVIKAIEEVREFVGKSMGAVGKALSATKDGIGDIIKGRWEGLKDNITEAALATGLVAVGAALTGGSALPVIGIALGIKAADALLPKGYQPLNWALENVSNLTGKGYDFLSAAFNRGQMVLKEDKEGEEPKLLPKRYKELEKAVVLELKSRGITVDKEQLKALVDPIAATLAKRAKEAKTEYAALGDFRKALKTELGGENGLLSKEIGEQNKRAEEDDKKAKAALEQQAKLKLNKYLEACGFTEGVKEIKKLLESAGMSGDSLESTLEEAVGKLKAGVVIAGGENLDDVERGKAALKNYVNNTFPAWVKPRKTVQTRENDNILPDNLENIPLQGEGQVVEKKPFAVVEEKAGIKVATNEAWIAILTAVGKGVEGKKFNESTSVDIAKAIQGVVEKTKAYHDPAVFEQVVGELKNPGRYDTTAKTKEADLPGRLVGIFTNPEKIAELTQKNDVTQTPPSRSGRGSR